MPTWAITMNLW